MKNILKYGSYQVGTEGTEQMAQTIHDVVHLRLECKERLPKSAYSLEELQQLESKLVLITGSMSKYVADVDKYRNVSTHMIVHEDTGTPIHACYSTVYLVFSIYT